MKARYRDLTEKYKRFRLQPDPRYLSRSFQTFFSKFTKKGKKALAQRHRFNALSTRRYTLLTTSAESAILLTLDALRSPLGLLYRRKGKVRERVPVPRRRTKGFVTGLHILYLAIQRRRERTLTERRLHEFLSLHGPKQQSPTFRMHSASRAILEVEKLNLDLRWR